MSLLLVFENFAESSPCYFNRKCQSPVPIIRIRSYSRNRTSSDIFNAKVCGITVKERVSEGASWQSSEAFT